jgi:hypothetical protein
MPCDETIIFHISEQTIKFSFKNNSNISDFKFLLSKLFPVRTFSREIADNFKKKRVLSHPQPNDTSELENFCGLDYANLNYSASVYAISSCWVRSKPVDSSASDARIPNVFSTIQKMIAVTTPV